MKTSTRTRKSSTLATLEMSPRGKLSLTMTAQGNRILTARKSEGNLEFKGPARRKAGARKGPVRARRASTQTTMEASH